MNFETIEKLCCPFDKSDLTLTEIKRDENQNVEEGFFVCKSCKRLYPIIKGIPIMSPDEYREFDLEKPTLDRWQKHLNGGEFVNFRLESAN